MSGETVNIRYKISTDNVGSECSDTVELDKDYWNSLSAQGKSEEIKEAVFEHLKFSYEKI